MKYYDSTLQNLFKMIGNLLLELYSIFPFDWYQSLINDYQNLNNPQIFRYYQKFVSENMNILISRKFSINEYYKQNEQINKVYPNYLYEFKVTHIKKLNNLYFILYNKLPDIEKKLNKYLNEYIVDFYTYPLKTYLINEISYQKTFVKNIGNKMSGYGLNPDVPCFIMT